MRLDHLLSREKAEVETRKPNQGRCDPEEAERSEEGSENKKMRTAQVIRCYPKRVSLCIVFRVRLTEEHVLIMWGFSSAGRAPALQAGGQRFDPANLHYVGR